MRLTITHLSHRLTQPVGATCRTADGKGWEGLGVAGRKCSGKGHAPCGLALCELTTKICMPRSIALPPASSFPQVSNNQTQGLYSPALALQIQRNVAILNGLYGEIAESLLHRPRKLQADPILNAARRCTPLVGDPGGRIPAGLSFSFNPPPPSPVGENAPSTYTSLVDASTAALANHSLLAAGYNVSSPHFTNISAAIPVNVR